ncbi:hypothetical protein GCM10027194_33890 [Thalassiella azotivora]
MAVPAQGRSREQVVALDPVSAVAACTTTAVHRRDHRHVVPGTGCHPHEVEVVHLGSRAVVVCHDCAQDTGFVPGGQAVEVAQRHQAATLSGDSRLAG